jgi:hypothetical protein
MQDVSRGTYIACGFHREMFHVEHLRLSSTLVRDILDEKWLVEGLVPRPLHGGSHQLFHVKQLDPLAGISQ